MCVQEWTRVRTDRINMGEWGEGKIRDWDQVIPGLSADCQLEMGRLQCEGKGIRET